MNADTYADTGTGAAATNMFAYCNNNPTMMVDPDGHTTTTTFLVYFLVIIITTIIIGYAVIYIQQLFSCLQKNSIKEAINNDIHVKKLIDISFINYLRSITLSTTAVLNQAIREGIEAARKTYNPKLEKHHIVAKDAPAASLGREVLKYVSIYVESWENLVDIKYNLHKTLHTSYYHQAVGNFLSNQYKYNSDKIYAVESGLLTIKIALLAANQFVA